MKVLVVDDTRTDRLLFVNMLRIHCGVETIVEAGDGAEALSMLSRDSFDLVCLDWSMPEMSGLEVLRAIRRRDSQVPVFMVTAEKSKQSVVNAFDAGANDYLTKPCRVAVLVRKIEALKRRKNESSKPAQAPRSALVVDNSSIVRKVLMGMLTDRCGFETIVQAANGQTAVDAAARGGFDLILLDWNMPEMTGIDALRAIRAIDKDTLVVMVTSEKNEDRILEAINAGANHYIVKPCQPETLAKTIERVFCAAK